MTAVHFVMHQNPVAWQRAGISRGHHYTQRETRAWEEAVAMHGKVAMRGRTPFTGPVELLVVFHLPIPSSWAAWKREAAIRGQVVPTTKPDFDNLAKGVSDALNGIAWDDDAQVVDAFTRKRYDALPCVIVHATPMDLLPAQVSRRPKA